MLYCLSAKMYMLATNKLFEFHKQKDGRGTEGRKDTFGVDLNGKCYSPTPMKLIHSFEGNRIT